MSEGQTSAQLDAEASDEQYNSSDGMNAGRKGQPWTEEEHLAFLKGLRALGKGNWRAIAKGFVPTRTPTQVASHAQKHFMRVAGATKRKSRFTALEVEVCASAKAMKISGASQLGQNRQQCHEQQPAPSAQQPSSFPGMPAAFPAMPFPCMPPMLFGFPLFPPFMCPPPAFMAAAMSAAQKQGPMPSMVMPPMFPMAAAAAMAAMNPMLMAQQMAAATQVAAANAAAVAAAHAATSGGTTAGTSPGATTDTANSGEVQWRMQAAATSGSPIICKPEAQHARPAAAASAGAVATGGGGLPCETRGKSPGAGVAREGAVVVSTGSEGGSLAEQAGMLLSAALRADDVVGAFHTSSHSAFRPPQEIKAEG